MTDQTMTPETLAGSIDSIPEWARGTTATCRYNDGGVDAWDLYQDGKLVGSMYDDGAGYLYHEGVGIDDGDWTDSTIQPMTTDHQTYPTEQAAEAARNELRGWPDAAVDQIYLPDHSDADADGNVTVLRCDASRYLRSDGYVR